MDEDGEVVFLRHVHVLFKDGELALGVLIEADFSDA